MFGNKQQGSKDDAAMAKAMAMAQASPELQIENQKEVNEKIDFSQGYSSSYLNKKSFALLIITLVHGVMDEHGGEVL